MRLRNTRLCAQAESSTPEKGSKVILATCNFKGKGQVWYETDRKEFVLSKLRCLDASGNVYMYAYTNIYIFNSYKASSFIQSLSTPQPLTIPLTPSPPHPPLLLLLLHPLLFLPLSPGRRFRRRPHAEERGG